MVWGDRYCLPDESGEPFEGPEIIASEVLIEADVTAPRNFEVHSAHGVECDDCGVV